MSSKEQLRLNSQGNGDVPLWYKWGPYVSERAWGTVREDYSANGDAWRYFPFEEAHSRVYRWGEDGIAGFCDRYQVMIFSPAFWNGKDPILKERLFGLSSHEGNHGEDVKEYYYYLDATPTHSYLKYLYKYPQGEFPYELLKNENAKRSTYENEYELVDTGILSNNRYFDIYIEYAKSSPEDICIRIQAFNRGDQSAPLHIIPQIWFRNQWSWGGQHLPKPVIVNNTDESGHICLLADDSKLLSPSNLAFDYHLKKRYLYSLTEGKVLFTDNENPYPQHSFHKSAFHRAVINNENCTNIMEKGTKAGIHYYFNSIEPGESVTVYLRLTDYPLQQPFADIEEIFEIRKKEADEFYESIYPAGASAEECMIQRQALAGLIWNKQIYLYDVNCWLKGDEPKYSLPESRVDIRNTHWRHLNTMRILLMPDKWEYPWFAAWDLAFQCISLGLLDMEFAKEQLWLLLFDQFQHPNGAIPAYEWEFSDLNPPVQAWAALRLFQMEYQKTGKKDFNFLKKCYLKLLMNFSFWVNKVDTSGCNVFEGGFLGLDNITIVDRSFDIPQGNTIKQADGTGWMGMFCLNLLRISLELSKIDPDYELMATKFFQHFVYISNAMKKIDFKKYNLWNEEDNFFYDTLISESGHKLKFEQLKIRSLVGLIPLFAVDVITFEELERLPEFQKNFYWFLANRKDITDDCVTKVDDENSYILSMVDEHKFQKIYDYIADPDEFLSNFGIRSLSKYHSTHPFIFKNAKIGYEPAESLHRLKGGNSNWRGPIWFPTNYLLIESFKVYKKYFKSRNIEIEEFANRLISLFKINNSGKRNFYGNFPFAQDDYFRDHILFYEYFNPETGEGLGASHQTGWTALVANLIDEFRKKL